jgi:hypothetical protein
MGFVQSYFQKEQEAEETERTPFPLLPHCLAGSILFGDLEDYKRISLPLGERKMNCHLPAGL